jgi:hypothetical protein
MWENCQRLTVSRDHAIVITKTNRPGAWFTAGAAFLAPLYRKRSILLDRAKWVYAWTLYNEEIGTSGWLTPADRNSSLHLPAEIHSRNSGGWYFTIPSALRRKAWLPEAGGIVIYEYSDTEANFWTQGAYNEESILEADAS